MATLTCRKTVTFDLSKSVEYESPSNSDCEEDTASQRATEDFPSGPYGNQLFHFNEAFARFRDEWRECKDAEEFADLAGLNEHQEGCLEQLLSGTSGPLPDRILRIATWYVDAVRELAPDWPDWGMIPRIDVKDDEDDADFLVALYVHCLKVVNDQQMREILADIIIDAFYEYEQPKAAKVSPLQLRTQKMDGRHTSTSCRYVMLGKLDGTGDILYSETSKCTCRS